MVKSSRKIDDNEIIKPNIIIGFDFSLTSLVRIVPDEDLSLSLLSRFEKSFLILNIFSRLLGH